MHNYQTFVCIFFIGLNKPPLNPNLTREQNVPHRYIFAYKFKMLHGLIRPLLKEGLKFTKPQKGGNLKKYWSGGNQ